MPATTARLNRYGPSTLDSSDLCIRPVGAVSNDSPAAGYPGHSTALFTRMSTEDQRSVTSRTAESIERSSPRSSWTATAVPPADSMAAARCVAPDSLLREPTATRAPSAPKAIAVARPMPELAPVTNAVRPSSWRSIWFLPGKVGGASSQQASKLGAVAIAHAVHHLGLDGSP